MPIDIGGGGVSLGLLTAIVVSDYCFTKLFIFDKRKPEVLLLTLSARVGRGPRVVVSTAAFHSAVWKKQICFFPIQS